ncbi:unnamed protein product [Kuraishia capsulata CBS 1993]|uniref:Mitochondrial import inner membrane translocase subunit n=1 Tax=Kuraishia capsulata CBS 1993 TaxID=1382522 RepID=W6MH90_9ASCO|nr:uncharacterized protein KUCA_T00001554001 [Kuraishia capsulata CBS 1993]CDK25584.1 unnamed protein product [Kuraishia capsulata CBS 1993]
MSLFLLNNNGLEVEANPQKIAMAEVQYDAMKATFDITKCIPGEYGEADLHKGEQTCIDRCVIKFMSANRIIGLYAQKVRLDVDSLKAHEIIKEKYCKVEILGGIQSQRITDSHPSNMQCT